jgi:DNA-binding CsgD family transcriptional regulator/tetratricopeptide (TPR) repeat protein
MTTSDLLAQAHEAFRGQAWRAAYAGFRAADEGSDLVASDLELYARSAYLVGEDDRCVALLERAYHRRLADDEGEKAAETAFWLAFNLFNRGEEARAGGWLARVEHHLTEQDRGCAVRGLLLVAGALRALNQGDAAAALDVFTQAHAIGDQCGDPELVALGGLGIGQARIALGDVEEGLRRLDAVMVAVTAGEVSPIVAGIVYCAVIVACHETYHLRRAAEWTKALSQWCEGQPDLVPFRGQCLVHRAQILQLNGAWEDAMDQVHLAVRRFADRPGQPAIGMAFYEQAELHRLRGEYAAAERAYQRSTQSGHETQPGLALLRLAQRRLDAAQAGIRRALDESRTADRPRLLAAYVEIALAAGDVDGARRAADDLATVAAARDVVALRALSAQASGAVLLAEGEPRKALDELRRSWGMWRELDAPFHCARVRALQARACQELGDNDAAQMELAAAADLFRQLRAEPELARMEGPGSRAGPTGPGGLTAREVQVLRVVASGKTNRAVAENLFLSEKTVARHVSNIFAKLNISSRSAATAYAYEHDLM